MTISTRWGDEAVLRLSREAASTRVGDGRSAFARRSSLTSFCFRRSWDLRSASLGAWSPLAPAGGNRPIGLSGTMAVNASSGALPSAPAASKAQAREQADRNGEGQPRRRRGRLTYTARATRRAVAARCRRGPTLALCAADRRFLHRAACGRTAAREPLTTAGDKLTVTVVTDGLPAILSRILGVPDN